jgi:hypothetical protein
VSVTAGWFHRDFKNLFRRTNTAQTFADYSRSLYAPIDGTPITYYNVARRPATASDCRRERVRRSEDVDAARVKTNARLPHGITMFGGAASA